MLHLLDLEHHWALGRGVQETSQETPSSGARTLPAASTDLSFNPVTPLGTPSSATSGGLAPASRGWGGDRGLRSTKTHSAPGPQQGLSNRGQRLQRKIPRPSYRGAGFRLGDPIFVGVKVSPGLGGTPKEHSGRGNSSTSPLEVSTVKTMTEASVSTNRNRMANTMTH